MVHALYMTIYMHFICVCMFKCVVHAFYMHFPYMHFPAFYVHFPYMHSTCIFHTFILSAFFHTCILCAFSRAFSIHAFYVHFPYIHSTCVFPYIYSTCIVCTCGPFITNVLFTYCLLQPLLRSKYSETLIVLYGQYNNVYILDSNTLEVQSTVTDELFL